MRTKPRTMTHWLLLGAVPMLLLGLAYALPSAAPTRAATAPAAVSTVKAAASTTASTVKAAVSTAVSTAKAAGPTATAVGTGRWPVAIHDGTCANPTTQPAYQLGNLAPYAGSSATAPATSGAMPVLTVQKTIDVKIGDLVSASQPRALVLHASAANYTQYLACGDLAGQPTSDDHAVIALRPLGGSGWYGIAELSGSKSVPVVGTNQTQITVYLFQSGAAGTPAA